MIVSARVGVGVGDQLLVEQGDGDGATWTTTVSHVAGDEIFVLVRDHISIDDVPVRCWVRCHHLGPDGLTEFRSLVLEAVDGAPARISLRPREATPRLDRRRHRRYDIVAPVQVESADRRIMPRPGETRDISLGGVRLVTTSAADVGDMIETKISLTSGVVEATAIVLGKIAKNGSHNELRCQFIKLTADSKDVLRNLSRTST